MIAACCCCWCALMLPPSVVLLCIETVRDASKIKPCPRRRSRAQQENFGSRGAFQTRYKLLLLLFEARHAVRVASGMVVECLR